ncbi:hypothetical protein INT47_012959 [Mucor saturninus]|uniref:Uncharacterized protein n=1 Tax=Mucor saturninus TaxID=64648 RepID=A0A8H7UXF6_9FUNG|nr:hypothetical protein INT47_012959 [Mucor saturninus]
MKNLHTNGCQNPDFIKLCNILKDELDHMANIEGKVAFGLLVEGCNAELYCMDLSYYKTYRLVMISRFCFPSSIHDIHILVNSFRRLDHLQSSLRTVADNLLNEFLNQQDDFDTTPIRTSDNTLISFSSPKR